MTDAAERARLSAAIDVALAAGRQASGGLQRLKSLLSDAQEREQTGMFWLLAFFRMFSRSSQRRQVMELTRIVQVDLTVLDAAVDALREHGVPLLARPVSRMARAQTPRARADGGSGPATVYDGPLDLAVTTLQRVEAVLAELRRLRDAGT
ncbi:MAG: hypothetical protein KDC98_11330 [Planctomycetes bacterium]|nr:hypothetical protein [Planctomycetota bacterium]